MLQDDAVTLNVKKKTRWSYDKNVFVTSYLSRNIGQLITINVENGQHAQPPYRRRQLL